MNNAIQSLNYEQSEVTHKIHKEITLDDEMRLQIQSYTLAKVVDNKMVRWYRCINKQIIKMEFINMENVNRIIFKSGKTKLNHISNFNWFKRFVFWFASTCPEALHITFEYLFKGLFNKNIKTNSLKAVLTRHGQIFRYHPLYCNIAYHIGIRRVTE